jgi:hypothetical protein
MAYSVSIAWLSTENTEWYILDSKWTVQGYINRVLDAAHDVFVGWK